MPQISNCFTNYDCGDCGPDPITGFALIRLVGPSHGSLFDQVTRRDIPGDTVWKAEINPATGCWQSCELPCNDRLFPFGSEYEVEEFVNGKHAGSHVVILDCANNMYPTPVHIREVAVTDCGMPYNVPSFPTVPACSCPA